MNHSFFHIHGPLTDFLEGTGRKRTVEFKFFNRPSVKDAFEAIGIPHPEVGLILIDNRPVGFGYNMTGGEKIDLYSHIDCPENFDEFRLPFRPSGRLSFILDVHLGRLARYMRAAGIDTIYEKEDMGDETIAGIAHKEKRIVLTRDVALLKRSSVIYGHWMRNTESRAQFREAVRHYGLKKIFRPFSRCAHCNGPIEKVEKSKVAGRLPKGVRQNFNNFFACTVCGQVYWEGTHYKRIAEFLEKA